MLKKNYLEHRAAEALEHRAVKAWGGVRSWIAEVVRQKRLSAGELQKKAWSTRALLPLDGCQ